MSRIIQALIDGFGSEPDFVAYNINDTTVTTGVPPIPVQGLEYIFAIPQTTQNKLIMCLTGDGVFVGNRNRGGIVEIAMLSASPSVAVIEALTTAGIPFPVFATDTATNGTASMFAAKCKPVQTPPWRREATPGITTFTLSTPRLIISHGVRKTN